MTQDPQTNSQTQAEHLLTRHTNQWVSVDSNQIVLGDKIKWWESNRTTKYSLPHIAEGKREVEGVITKIYNSPHGLETLAIHITGCEGPNEDLEEEMKHESITRNRNILSGASSISGFSKLPGAQRQIWRNEEARTRRLPKEHQETE